MKTINYWNIFLFLLIATIGTSQNLSVVASVTDLDCNIASGLPNGAVDVTVAGGAVPYTYMWSNGSLYQDQTGLYAGTYSVTVTDANGDTVTDNYTLTEPTPVDISEVLDQPDCNTTSGVLDGGIDITASGGTAPYTYSWTGPNTVATDRDQNGLGTGYYNVTITDINGCSVTASYGLTEPTPVDISEVLDQPDCNVLSGVLDGGIDITASGGTAPYTYNWTGPNTVAADEDQTGLGTGTSDVTITDSNGCTVSASYTLTEPTPIAIAEVIDQPDCNGFSGVLDGGIDITASGGTTPYSFLWTGPNTETSAEDQTGLGTGTYDLIITDVNGCMTSASYTLTEPIAIEITGATIDLSNHPNSGRPDGVIDITVAGGQGSNALDYTYYWSTTDGSNLVQAAADQVELGAGTYCVTATDSNGCTAEACFTLSHPTSVECTLDSPIVGAGGTNALCYDDLAEINGTAAGGTAPYTYSINGGAFQSAAHFSVEAGSYVITTKDANGGESTCEITVTAPSPLEFETEEKDGGVLELRYFGGVRPYALSYTAADPNQLPLLIETDIDISHIEGLEPNATYNFTIMDANGCDLTFDYLSEEDDQVNALATPELCLVTNNIESGNNLLLWEDPEDTENFNKYHIYREGITTGKFVLIGKTAFVSVNRFEDKVANPAMQAYRYHIRAVDKAEQESEPSDVHKTVHLVMSQGLNGSVNLSWDNYVGLDYDQILINRGTSADALEQLVKLPTTSSTYTDLDPPAGAVYYQLVIPMNIECNINKAIYSVQSNLVNTEQLSFAEELTFTVKLYPNPSFDVLYIESGKELESTLVDIVGRTMLTKSLAATQNTIDVSAFQTGVYYLQLTDGKSSWTEKIVIENN